MAEDALQFHGHSDASLSKKPKVSDCGLCHVKLGCSRHSVHVKWVYTSFNLKADLRAVKIEGCTFMMEWNTLAKKWSNEARVSKPPFTQLNCPSLEFLRAVRCTGF